MIARHTQQILVDKDKSPFDGGPVGDCLRASIASLLNMDPDSVPHFASLGILEPKDSATHNAWWCALVGWAYLLDPSLSVTDIDESEDAWPSEESWLGGHCLAAGLSPRGDFLHCVVARSGEVVWDPHPSRDGLPYGIERLTIFTPIKG